MKRKSLTNKPHTNRLPHKEILDHTPKAHRLSKRYKSTATDLLRQHNIIDQPMKQAADLYAEVEFLHPAGGPAAAHLPGTLSPLKKGNPPEEYFAEHLEPLWHKLHHILNTFPIRFLAHEIFYENSYVALQPFYESCLLRFHLRQMLRQFIGCFVEHRRMNAPSDQRLQIAWPAGGAHPGS